MKHLYYGDNLKVLRESITAEMLQAMRGFLGEIDMMAYLGPQCYDSRQRSTKGGRSE